MIRILIENSSITKNHHPHLTQITDSDMILCFFELKTLIYGYRLSKDSFVDYSI